jgi:hypothetical protein
MIRKMKIRQREIELESVRKIKNLWIKFRMFRQIPKKMVRNKHNKATIV